MTSAVLDAVDGTLNWRSEEPIAEDIDRPRHDDARVVARLQRRDEDGLLADGNGSILVMSGQWGGADTLRLALTL